METGRVPDLQEVADHLAIYDVLVTHSRGVDRAEAETLKTAYWPDAEVAYGGFNGPAHAFCESLPQAIKHYARTQHTISNVAIELRGDDAVVETYVTAYHYFAVNPEADTDDKSNEDQPDTEMTYLGRYLDRMQKRQDVWKILHRQVVMDWNQNAAATAILEGPPFDGLARGSRFPDDPLYTLLAV